MTWEEYRQVVADIAAKWGRLGVLSDASQKQYFGDLKELPLELVLDAIEAIYRGELMPPTGWRIRTRALELDAIAQQRPSVSVGATERAEPVWAAMLACLHEIVGEEVVRSWFSDLRPVAIEDHTLYLEAPPSSYGWVRRRFAGVLTAAVKAVEGIARVEVLAGEERAA